MLVFSFKNICTYVYYKNQCCTNEEITSGQEVILWPDGPNVKNGQRSSHMYDGVLSCFIIIKDFLLNSNTAYNPQKMIR